MGCAAKQSITGIAPAPAARLEPNAIGVAQDTIIGLANTGPTVSVGFTLALLAGTAAYAGGLILVITAIPMLIANAYRRLNIWNANCGASFEWVGRSISPYLGYPRWRLRLGQGHGAGLSVIAGRRRHRAHAGS